jgi:hypothetical protein
MINGKPVDKVEYRWDGRFTLPTIIYGFTVLEAALRRVEPHFRSTGFYRAHLAVMLGALNTYLAEWAGSLVWTSEMPATLPGGTPIGFQQYPCQVVDPVFGVSARQDDFWYSDHNVGLATGTSTAHDPDALPFGLTEADQALETWTAEDRAEFLARRAQLLSRVTHDSGWWSLATYGTNLARFLEPPTESECVEVFNDKRQRSFPAFRKGVKGQNTPVSVETNGSPFSDPQTFVGQLRTRAVKTSVPVTIQPNPVPSGKVRTAASDVEFGYRVAVAAGGPGKPVEVLSRPLRRAIGEPGIYHDAQNKLRKPFPYTIKTTVTIAASTSTILVNKQGTKRLQHGKKETHDVTFTCRVTVGDPGSPGVADTEQDPARGFINVEILSTDPDAQSYEVTFAVTETVPAVPSPGTSNTSLSTYVVHGVLPVDARVIELPEAYFDAVEQEEAERAQLQQMLEHAHRKYAPVLAPISRPPKGDPFGELLVLLRDPGLASAIGVEAQRVLGRRLAQRELTALVQRAGSLARREASATSLVRPELPRLRGQRIDLLAPLPAPGLTAEAALATEEGSA